VAAVLAVLAIGGMARASIMAEVEKIGGRMIWVSLDWQLAQENQSWTYMRHSDLERIKGLLPGVCINLGMNDWRPVYREGKGRDSSQVQGVDENYLPIWQWKVARGRFIGELDNRTGAKVAVIGSRLALALAKPGEDPLGMEIRIGEGVFTVVGVMAERARGFMNDGTDDGTVYIPYNVLERQSDWSWTGGPVIWGFSMLAPSMDEVKRTEAVLVNYFKRQYGDLDGKPRFQVHVVENAIAKFQKILGIVTAVVALIAGISLLVSGIGIMNIMLVTVSERTREIGIRKSLGATRSDILGQFLVEALFISALGGVAGLGLGLAVSAVVAASQGWAFHWPAGAMAASFGISLAIGLFFGTVPARMASRLDPIVALSQE
jgi:ABC-type antimicrobial peptide transport system permease subunit